VQSKQSAASREVSKEILYALKKDKMVKPFVIEDSQLRDELEFELSTTHYIDATRPELDDRIRELAKDICRTLGKTFTSNEAVSAGQSTEVLLSTPSVIPKRVFCGRDGLLEQLHDRFRGGERVVFLSGIGGIGKTQIAKQYAKKFRDDYETIVFATYDGSLKELILADSPFCLEPELARYTLSDGTVEDDDSFFDRKLEKIKKLSDQRTLIIIDNFDVEQDPCLPELTEGRYHLLITTRCDYSRFYPTLRVDPIASMEDLKQLFFQNYDGFDVEADDPALLELIELVNRHTYTVELLAQHMESSGQTAAEMVEALKREGILSLNEVVTNTQMKTQVAYENLLKMFKLFTLSREERGILMYLSLMPPEGVAVRDFRQWAQLASNAEIKSLERRSWIIKNTQGIALHPIIRQVIRCEIPATEENCADFIGRFSETITPFYTWHMRKTDKDRYAAVAKSVISCFPLVTAATAELYLNVESLMSFAVDPAQAAVLIKKYWDYCVKTYPELSYETGFAAFKRGWLYAYNPQLPDSVRQACIWLKKSCDIFECIPMTNPEQQAAYSQNLSNLSKMQLVLYSRSGDPADYALAMEYAQKALDFSVATFHRGQSEYIKVANSHWHLSNALYAGGAYEEALENIDIAIDILVEFRTEHDSDSLYALFHKAETLYALGDVAEAEKLARKSGDGYIEFFGMSHPNVYLIFDLLGRCRADLGDVAGALEAFDTALQTAKMIYAPGTEQITGMEAKIAQCK